MGKKGVFWGEGWAYDVGILFSLCVPLLWFWCDLVRYFFILWCCRGMECVPVLGGFRGLCPLFSWDSFSKDAIFRGASLNNMSF